MPKLTLRSKSRHFILRAPKRSDIESYRKNKNDREVAKGFVFFDYPYTLTAARKSLNGLIRDNRKGKELALVIDVDGEAVGEVGLADIIPKLKAKLYYWIGKKYRGKGITTEAVRLMTDHAFKKYGLKRIYAWGRMYNKASARVLQKAGYRFEGVMRKNVLKKGKYYDDFIYAKVR